MKNEAMMIAGVLLVIFGVGFAHANQLEVKVTAEQRLATLEEKHSKVLSVLLKHNRRLNELEAEVKKLKQGVDAKVEADVSETMQEALTGELRKH